MAKIKRPIECDLDLPLTATEARERGTKAIGLLVDLEQIETAYNEHKRAENSKIKKLKGEIKALAKASHAKVERQHVMATEVIDPSTMRAWVEHDGHKFNERACTQAEMLEASQKPIFGDQPTSKLRPAPRAVDDDELEGSEGDDEDAGDDLTTADLVNPPGGPQTVEDVAGGIAAVGG